MHLALRVPLHADELVSDAQTAVTGGRAYSAESRPCTCLSEVGALAHPGFDADAFGPRRVLTEVDLFLTD